MKQSRLLLLLLALVCAVNAYSQTNVGTSASLESSSGGRDNTVLADSHQPSFEGLTNLVEKWVNLNQWTNDGANLIMRAGGLYSLGVANPSGLNHAFPMGRNDEARIIFSLTVVDGLSGAGLAFIGVSSDPTGAGVAPGDPNGLGIGVSHNGTINQALFFNKKMQTFDRTNQMPAGSYIGFVLIDTNNVCFSLTYPGGTNHFVQTVSRASIGDINNVSLWSSDTLGTNGIVINYVAAMPSPKTNNTYPIVEASAECLQWTTDDAGQRLLIWTPPQTNLNTPLPLYIKCHGYDWDEKFLWVGQSALGAPERGYYQQLVTNGWIVASSFQHGNNWGNSNSVQDISNLVQWVRRHYAISSIWVEGSSMGGYSALNWIARHPREVSGFVGLYCCTSLKNMFQAGDRYVNSIGAAYNLAPGGHDFTALTEGYDPLSYAANSSWRVPNIWFYDPGDGLVNSTSNTLAFRSRISGMAGESRLVKVVSGGHGGAGEYQATNVLTWRARNLPGR